MNRFESKFYYSFKKAIREAIEDIPAQELSIGRSPVILVDYHLYTCRYFQSMHQALTHIENVHTSWEDEPPSGEDEYLVVFKFCSEAQKASEKALYSNYRFFRKINGVNIYRQKSFVEFEPETIVNAYI